MCAGTREDGSVIEPNDPFWDDLSAVAEEARNDPKAWLEMRHVYGDLADHSGFRDAFDKWLKMIWAQGIDVAIDSYIAV
jgi:mannitol 2-dehydrogenase